jgi:hypothetical protein
MVRGFLASPAHRDGFRARSNCCRPCCPSAVDAERVGQRRAIAKCKDRTVGFKGATIFNIIVELFRDETETVSVRYPEIAPTLLCRMQGYHPKNTLHMK